PLAGTALQQRTTLWGALGEAKVEVDALGLTFEATGLDKQARSTAHAFLDPAGGPYTPADSVVVGNGRHENYRSLWRGGLSARRVTERWSAEVRWLYQSRLEIDRSFLPFHAHDRLLG